MTPSKQLTSATRIARAKAVLYAQGFLINESEPYSRVHRVHEDGSFHYVTQSGQSLAADLNYPGGGSREKVKFEWALKVLRSYGLGWIYNSSGHYEHTHFDCGSFRRTDNGIWAPIVPMSDLRAYRTEHLQAATRVKPTNLWSSALERRINAVKAASRYGGTKFPYGIKYTQAVIGAKQTGKWDAQSRLAHDATVKKIEKALGIRTPNVVWDVNTSKAVSTAKKEAVKA